MCGFVSVCNDADIDAMMCASLVCGLLDVRLLFLLLANRGMLGDDRALQFYMKQSAKTKKKDDANLLVKLQATIKQFLHFKSHFQIGVCIRACLRACLLQV